MASFISVSETAPATASKSRSSGLRDILRLVTLLVVMACSILGAWRYVLKLSPEVDLYTYAAKKKIACARKLDERGVSKIVIYGGSSCAFGVNTDAMQTDFQLPIVNFGMHAGMGAPVLTGLALKYTKPGDTLIVSLEPHLLFVPFDWPALGDQISYALQEPDLCEGGPLHLSRRGALGTFLTMRPGAQNMLLFLPRELSHEKVIYAKSTFSPSGWQSFDAHAQPKTVSMATAISADAQTLLNQLVGYCRQNNIRVAYAVPWFYCDGAQLVNYKSVFSRYLCEVSRFIPVLKDSTLGIDTDPDDFADGNNHLRPRGATRRGKELAKLIVEWRTWDAKELAAYSGSLGNNLAAVGVSSPSAAPRVIGNQNIHR
jgi:hypothetical protein